MPASSISTSVSVRIYEYASSDSGQANKLFDGACSACRPGGKPAGDVPATAIVDAMGQFSLSDSVLSLNGDNGIVGRLLEVVTSGDKVVTQCTIGRSSEDMATQVPLSQSPPTAAQCVLQPTDSSIVQPFGTMHFVAGAFNSSEGVFVSYNVSRLPFGPRGTHVHQWGNISAADGTAAGPHFVGDCGDGLDGRPPPCRPAWASIQEVGMLWNNGLLNATTLGATPTVYSGFDDTIRLYGNRSIIGRSIIVHQYDTGGPRLAQCVIGIANPSWPGLQPQDCVLSTTTTSTQCETCAAPEALGVRTVTKAIEVPPMNGGAPCDSTQEQTLSCVCTNDDSTYRGVEMAVCTVQNTSHAAAPITGLFRISHDAFGHGLRFSYDITGLPEGSHPFHVHEYGDISDPQALLTGGHFIGTCESGTPCRPDTVPQEVGMLDGGLALHSTAGRAKGVFIDPLPELAGKNSIVGRSIVIHNGSDPAKRIAQCVIGIAEDFWPVPSDGDVPVPKAGLTCSVTPTEGNAVRGIAHVVQSSNNSVVVSHLLNGITGSHGTHVHIYGDVSERHGFGCGGHFIGDCGTRGFLSFGDCRPSWAAAQEVGMLWNTGQMNGTVLLDGNYTNMAYDSVIRLSGNRSVVGRSLVIHEDPTGGARIGQCVLGRMNPASLRVTDCSVSNWGAWQECTPCRPAQLMGQQLRVRSIVRPAFDGGIECPPLQEYQTCDCPGADPDKQYWAVLGIVLAGVFLVGFVAAMFFIRRRIKRQRRAARMHRVDGTQDVQDWDGDSSDGDAELSGTLRSDQRTPLHPTIGGEADVEMGAVVPRQK